MKSLQQIQQEIREWTAQFGDNVSQDVTSVSCGARLGNIPPHLGMMEELGELSRYVGRRHQGRGYDNYDEWKAGVEDALADMLIFMCDFANRTNVDLLVALNTVWAKVSQRRKDQWAADKARESEFEVKSIKPLQDTRTVAQVLAQRNTVTGCCSTHADNQACDCLIQAEARERKARLQKKLQQGNLDDPNVPPGDRSGV